MGVFLGIIFLNEQLSWNMIDRFAAGDWRHRRGELKPRAKTEAVGCFCRKVKRDGAKEMLSSRTEFLNGVKTELPLLLGVMPYGMIYGALAVKLGLPPALALAMSAIVFAGSSQLIATPLMAAGMSGVVIVATTFVVNLRHALYSASVAPFIKQLPLRWKVLLAYLLTDEAYAVTITRFTQPDSSAALNRHWFYFGAGLTLWSSWQISSAIGIFVGQLIPDSWSLDFTLA